MIRRADWPSPLKVPGDAHWEQSPLFSPAQDKMGTCLWKLRIIRASGEPATPPLHKAGQRFSVKKFLFCSSPRIYGSLGPQSWRPKNQHFAEKPEDSLRHCYKWKPLYPGPTHSLSCLGWGQRGCISNKLPRWFFSPNSTDLKDSVNNQFLFLLLFFFTMVPDTQMGIESSQSPFPTKPFHLTLREFL